MTRISLDELVTEQKERMDAAYLAAVNAGLDAAIKEADLGLFYSADEVWNGLLHENNKTLDREI